MANRIFFRFYVSIFIYFFKYETIVRSSAWSFGHSDSDPSMQTYVILETFVFDINFIMQKQNRGQFFPYNFWLVKSVLESKKRIVNIKKWYGICIGVPTNNWNLKGDPFENPF